MNGHSVVFDPFNRTKPDSALVYLATMRWDRWTKVLIAYRSLHIHVGRSRRMKRLFWPFRRQCGVVWANVLEVDK